MSRFKSKQYIMRGYGSGNEAIFVYQSELYRNRGAGIGSIFSNIYSSVVPLFKSAFKIGSKLAKTDVGKSVIKSAKKKAMQAGINVVNDALQGKNVVASTKQQVQNIKQDLKKGISRGLETGISTGINAALNKKKPKNLQIQKRKALGKSSSTFIPNKKAKLSKTKKSDIFDLK